MTSYEQFTYYQENNVFEVTTNNEPGLFAFIIYNSNLQLSNLTFPDNIINDLETVQASGNINGTYNILFRYKPSGIYTTSTFNKKWFFHTTGAHLNQGLVIDWVNDPSKLGDATVTISTSNPDPETSAFTGTFNREFGSEDVGSGGGDPHIRPYFNPCRKTYLLPTNDNIFKYFDTQDTSERIVINVKMELLSFDRIIFAEELKIKRQGRNNWDKVPQAIENIIKYPKTMETKDIFDPSFAKYISIIYQSDTLFEKLTIDVETLQIITESHNEKIIISDIEDPDKYNYKGKNGSIKNTKMRVITILSKKLDTIKVLIYRDYDRLNHRNHISLIFKNNNKNYLKKCSGILMNIKTHGMIVPYLDYIDSINYNHNTNNKLEIVDNYLTKLKKPLRERRFKIRNMIRTNDFTLLS